MQPSQDVNKKKIYVGNLPYEVRDNDLKELVAEYGPVSEATVIMDRRTDRSKGFGFVEFETEEAAAAAVEALDGHELDGRALKVNLARPKQPREDRRGGGYRN